MLSKKILSILAIAFTLVAFFPYLRAIFKAQVKPHVFSWIIWGMTTLIVFFAELKAKGGVGAWPIGVSASITLLIAWLAFQRRGELKMTKLDLAFFVLALSSLPLWYFTSHPLSAVMVLTLVDLLGFGPTLRKVYVDPYSESLIFFMLFTIRNFLVILSLEHYSLTTVLFPAAIGLACLLLLFLTAYRRRYLTLESKKT
ncbi:MAG: hypothetical protein KDK66_02580 [Deltaproteobacteria bacterium]|nr:hypothetical protein [Deltaproteobacteria bacterium]